LRGTFAPFFRASDRPIAIACLRLFTVPPLPPRPLFRVPFFLRRIALSTRFDADFPYRRPPDRFEELFRFAVAIGSPRIEFWLRGQRQARQKASHMSRKVESF